MLLRVVSPPPLPTILFTLSFPTLPPSLSLPPAWEAHLHLLANAQLAPPPSLHALDKSVVWTVLLDVVTFDLTSLTVTCTFIDGVHEEWPLTNRCVDLLESVIHDVTRSATEAEAELEQQHQATDADRNGDALPVDVAPEQPPATPQKTLRPKKRRSFFASLVTSLVTSSPFSGSPPSARSSTPPAPPVPAPASLPPQPIEEPERLVTNGIPASRFLRRRARSTLVDVFRRFVVGELGARFRTGHPGAFYDPIEAKEEGRRVQCVAHGPRTPHYALWVVRSTMRRVAEEMVRVVEYALYLNETRDGDPEGIKPKEDERTKEDEKDGDDAGSATSTTDGSSVHTPVDYHDKLWPPPLPRPPPTFSDSPHYQVSIRQGLTLLTPQAYHAYMSLKDMHHRLCDMASKLAAHAITQEQDGSGTDAAAEVRSRRRAWSARQYLVTPSGSSYVAGRSSCRGGASMALLGLAVPVRSSPLCNGWNLEDMAVDVDYACGIECEADEDAAWGRPLRRVRSLYGEPQPQHGRRRRCHFTATVGMKSCEAEDVYDGRDFTRLWNRACCARSTHRGEGKGGQEQPLALTLVYATGPPPPQRYRSDDIDDDDDDRDEDRNCDEDEDEDDTHDGDADHDEGVQVSEVPVLDPSEEVDEMMCLNGKQKEGREDERGIVHDDDGAGGNGDPHSELQLPHHHLHRWPSYPPGATTNGSARPMMKRLLPPAVAVAVESDQTLDTPALFRGLE